MDRCHSHCPATNSYAGETDSGRLTIECEAMLRVQQVLKKVLLWHPQAQSQAEAALHHLPLLRAGVRLQGGSQGNKPAARAHTPKYVFLTLSTIHSWHCNSLNLLP